MLKAVALNEWSFCHASSSLQKDFDVAVLAYAGSRRFVEHLRRLAADERDFEKRVLIEDHRIKIREKVELSGAFVRTILFAVSFDSQCARSLLNQGAETSLMGYKRRIADFLDVPVGRELRILRRACENL